MAKPCTIVTLIHFFVFCCFEHYQSQKCYNEILLNYNLHTFLSLSIIAQYKLIIISHFLHRTYNEKY